MSEEAIVYLIAAVGALVCLPTIAADLVGAIRRLRGRRRLGRREHRFRGTGWGSRS